MIGRLSKARFDVKFGPHRFRYAIATTAPLRAPEHPGWDGVSDRVGGAFLASGAFRHNISFFRRRQ